jgi:hypothetical protein
LEGIVHGVDVNIGENNNINCIDDNIDYSIGDDKGKCVLAFYEEAIINEDEIPEELRKNGAKPFFYTGSPQEFVVPPGVKELKLEVWGANGGDGLLSGEGTGTGGRGGYSYGNLNVVSEQKLLYIYVGEVGVQNSLVSTFNGGGMGLEQNGSGGGATDVRTEYGNGNWNDTNSIKTRLIVAGGGGGASAGPNEYGGYGGGGNNGGGNANGSWTYGLGGGNSQCSVYPATNPQTSGGGGYYNGCIGGVPAGGGGGGGSGYIGGVTNGGGSNGVRSGHGVAKICWGNRIGECNGTAPPDTE